MLANISWGLMGMIVVVTVLLAINQGGRRAIKEADRRYKAALDAASAPESHQDPRGRGAEGHDMTK